MWSFLKNNKLIFFIRYTASVPALPSRGLCILRNHLLDKISLAVAAITFKFIFSRMQTTFHYIEVTPFEAKAVKL